MRLLLMMRNARRERAYSRSLRWKPHGVGLDWAPCGVVDTDDTTSRANSDHGSKVSRSI